MGLARQFMGLQVIKPLRLFPRILEKTKMIENALGVLYSNVLTMDTGNRHLTSKYLNRFVWYNSCAWIVTTCGKIQIVYHSGVSYVLVLSFGAKKFTLAKFSFDLPKCNHNPFFPSSRNIVFCWTVDNSREIVEIEILVCVELWSAVACSHAFGDISIELLLPIMMKPASLISFIDMLVLDDKPHRGSEIWSFKSEIGNCMVFSLRNNVVEIVW